MTSRFTGSAHDAIGQLTARVERLQQENGRLIRALRAAIAARDDPERLRAALDAAEAEIDRVLRGR